MCGSSLKAEATVPAFSDPGQLPPLPPQVAQPQMVLERLGNKPEEFSTALSFTATDGDVNVNRQDLDQNNFTITSKTQASFIFRDGRWWLLDRSDLKTTFVQVREAVELKEGDIIQMGDRKFIFHPRSPEGYGGTGKTSSSAGQGGAGQ
jgi:hypothetical protein